ncbi:hypothetical protein VTK73DRAFT_215 [Phialemonium thermophilum]|uniref:Uncharacterized protein n=1 Tax=Phialemonium thermophilum TaxID=223376 RepID=A0ABR3VWE0_9PEZI
MRAKSDTKRDTVEACASGICEKRVQPRTVTRSERSTRLRLRKTKRPRRGGADDRLSLSRAASAAEASSNASSLATAASYVHLREAIVCARRFVRLVVAHHKEDQREATELGLQEREQARVVHEPDVAKERQMRALGLELEVCVHGQRVRSLQMQIRHDLQRDEGVTGGPGCDGALGLPSG